MPEGLGLIGQVDPGSGYGLMGGLETAFVLLGSQTRFTFHARHVNFAQPPDRYVDRVVVTEIDGLHGGPEMRIAEELNQADHGGFALDGWLGGRTLTFTGRIEAYTLNKLRDMQNDMRMGLYGDLSEQTLTWTLQTPNRYLANVTQFSLKCRLADKILMRDVQTNGNTFWRDFQFSLRATDPTIKNFTQKTLDKNTYADINFSWVGSNYTTTTGLMHIDPLVRGQPSTVQNTSIAANSYTMANGRLVPPSGLSSYFFRISGPSNNQSVSGGSGMSIYRPGLIYKVLTPSPITTNDYCAVVAKNGIGTGTNDYLWAQLEHTSATQARLKWVKTVSGTPTILATGTAFTVAADTNYWIKTTHSKTNVLTAALYSTDPGPTGAGTQVGTTLSYTLVAGDTSGGTGSTYFSASGFPSSGIGYVASTAFDSYELDQIRIKDEGDATNDAYLTGVNWGNWPAKAFFVITGPITNANIFTMNGSSQIPVFGESRQFIVNGAIPAASTYTYDPVNGLFYKDNITTNDVYSQINSQSRELYVPPGISTWYMTGTGTTGATALQLKINDTFI